MITMYALIMLAVVAAVFLSVAGVVGGFNPTDKPATVPVQEEAAEEQEDPISIFDEGVHVDPLPGAAQMLPEDLVNLTVQRLRQLAAERGVVVLARDRKADIIRKLQEALPV